MENRAAPENKRYTLTDEIIDTVIRLKDAAMEEMDRFDEYERMKMNHSGMSRFTAKMLVKRQNDRLFGTFKFPAEHALRAYLDTLTDDNLLDLALLYYMAETNDVTLSVEPGEPRLTCLAVLPSHSAFMVSVRQARVLPPSSSRFRLAADTLDFG